METLAHWTKKKMNKKKKKTNPTDTVAVSVFVDKMKTHLKRKILHWNWIEKLSEIGAQILEEIATAVAFLYYWILTLL